MLQSIKGDSIKLRMIHHTLWACSLCLIAALGVSGCGVGGIDPTSGDRGAPATPAAILSGAAHGGQNPISGATLQLYAAGEPAAPTSGTPTGGLGQGARALLAVGSMSLNSSNNYWPNGSTHLGATCAYTTGNPNNCTALPMTDANGNFTITGDYTCPSANAGASPLITPQVYLVATGGNPGLGGSVNNRYIALMAALGACSGLSSATFVNVDEVTTVGAVWALQQFLAAPTGTAASAYASQGGGTTGIAVNIGANSGPVGGYGPDAVQSQQAGLVNAFTMVNNLVNNSSGLAGSSNSAVTAYNAKINTIANTLAACVNSDGATSNLCSTLMADATVGSQAPADTLQAAYLMAQNPMNNVATLVALGTASSPFQPTLASTTANLDLTLQVAFAPTYGASSGFSGANAVYNAQQIAIDENGNAWLLNKSASGNTGGLTGSFVSEIGVNGAVLSGPFQSYTVSGGFTSIASPCPTESMSLSSSVAYQMAIDQNSYLWVGNYGETTITCAGSSYVRSLMRIDTDTATVATGYWEEGDVEAVTVDGSNNVWWAGQNTTYQAFVDGTSEWTSSSGGLGTNPSGAAVDTLGNVWIDDGTTCTAGTTTGAAGVLYELPSATISSTPTISNGFYNTGDTACTGGTQTTTAVQANVIALATDANDGVWAANQNPSQVTYFAPQSNSWTTAVSSSSTIPTTGAAEVSTGNLNAPQGIAVDGANNAWVVGNSTNTGATSDSLEEFSVSLASGSGNIASINTLADYIFPSTASPFPHYEHSVSIDPSGNLWISSGTSSVNWVTVVVGLAAPVVTPLTFQAEYNIAGATTTPTLNASSYALTYAATAIGATATAQTVSMTNSGPGSLNVSSVSLSGADPNDFVIASNTCTGLLQSGGTCSVSVSLSPIGTGTRTANLALTNNGVVTPLTIALNGTGLEGTSPIAPVFSPAAGSYSLAQIVTLTDAAYGATLYYTTNGATPTTSSTVYTQPFVVAATQTVKVLVVAPGYASNTTASAAYTISGATPYATVSVNATGTKTAVGKSFMGMSMDLNQVQTYFGTSSGTIGSATLNTTFVNLMSNFTQYLNGPLSFRLLNDAAFSSLTEGPTDTFAALGAFYNYMKSNSTNGVQYWVGLNLQNDFTTTSTTCGSATGTVTVYADCNGAQADAYTAASSLPAGSLLGFELGNEPDWYANTGHIAASGSANGVPWNYTNFFAAYQAIVPGIVSSVNTTNLPQANSALPSGNNGAIMLSPCFGANSAYFGSLASFISAESTDMTMVNVHYYPGYYNPPTNSVASDFLMQTAAINNSGQPSSPIIMAGTADGGNIITQAHTTTNAAGNTLPIRIGEMNSVAGGGQPGVSNSFQAALWVMDQAMQFATYKVDGINIFNGSKYYAPMYFTTGGTYPNLTFNLYEVGPIYYGMLMADQFLQNNASLVPLTLSTTGSFTVSAYSSLDTNGAVRVLLINKTESSGGEITVTLSGHGAATLTYLQATGNNYLASDYTSTSGGVTAASSTPSDEITIGGQTFKNSTSGLLQGTQTLVTATPSSSVYTIPLPQASAVLVTIP